ncbi:MAG: crossover junction endodeoxyribonuclease RuvC [Bacteroidales bacterium]|nr:crossover junction endodeoxyribonuclease RuvC [Bacteroidales bacterium]MBD5205062.1 crossover junction endodeoxyribonuclease RuvC [Bacteroidales bacterium]MBD5222579.1 crossover junction endodeoxyribonuclease RuvC [Bacteroidales bacterium]
MEPNLKKYERIIMGIDPGTNVMGYGILGVNGKKAEVIVLGVIELNKFESHYKRLHRIFERVSSLASQYLPDEVALEAPFFGKNVQSMLKLGRAQGVAMAAVLNRDIPVAEYAPRTIKMAVTGNGQASKEQVANMLRHLLDLSHTEIPKFMDATDALAVALTHLYETGKPEIAKGPKSWAEFIARNPNRVAPRRRPDNTD